MEQPEQIPADARKLGSVTIKPGSMQRLDLGLYKLDNPPKFRIECEPDVEDALEYNDSKPTDGEVYILFRQFQNFSHHTCTVTVWWVGGGPDLRGYNMATFRS